MNIKKSLCYLSALVLTVICLFVIKYILIDKHTNTIEIDDKEYYLKRDSILFNIDSLNTVIKGLNDKAKHDADSIKNLDDSSTVELFIKLVKGE